MIRAAAVFALAALWFDARPIAAQAIRPEVITGRVTTDSGTAIAGAAVFATMAPDREVFTDSTGSDGRYRLQIPNGTGDYLVYISAPGRKPFRKRITRDSTAAASSTFTVDAALSPAVTQLAAVRVQAERPRPSRGKSFEAETGAAEFSTGGINGAVAPELAGDISALAATTPGALATGAGISILGLDAGQTRTTLNGMSFSGGDLPRDVRTRTRVYAGTFDPARGGFSGGEVAVELDPGGSFSGRRGRISLDAPPLQARDPLGRGLDPRFTRVHGSVGGDGPIGEGRWHYNYGADVRRRTSDAVSLLDADVSALGVAGVAADSAARLLTVLRAAGIPVASSGMPESRVTTEATLLARVDHGRYKPNTFLAADRTWSLTGYGRIARAERLQASLLATPGSSTSRDGGSGALQGELSTYLGPERMWLNTLRNGFSARTERTAPYLELPSGEVLVSSLLEGGMRATTALGFGGNAGSEREMRGWTWELTDDLEMHPPRQARHRLKVHFSSRLEDVTETSGEDAGQFSYGTLADLERNSPSSFARTLGTADRHSGAWNGAIAIGDMYRRSQRFQLLYGLRLDAGVARGRPAFNAALEQALGVRNDAAPSGVHVSPRLGFTWVVGKATPSSGYGVSSLGVRYWGPKGVIRGGVGSFRNAIAPTLLGDASANDGLGGVRQLRCIGAATPVPSWSALASGAAPPAQCRDGAGALADVAPPVSLVAPGYAAPRSWRGNISWGATTLRQKLDYTIDAIYSLNLDQPGTRDLNFAGVQRFTLADEARPVFVNTSSIVPASGIASTVDARRSSEFGRVTSRHSGLRSTSRQVTLTLTPALSMGRYYVSGAYTLASTRALASGFDGDAFGDPREEEWSRGTFDARHRVQLQLGMARRGWSITTFLSAMSGLPYTPVVKGDVNGDGTWGDRAFVHEPAGSDDPAFRTAMQSLLEDGEPRARDCLAGQVGRAARRNSCEGPWSTSMNMQLTPSGAFTQRALRTKRAAVSLNIANPLGGLDQLLHGRDLRGWGSPGTPDPVLYTVRGFDPATRRFQYEVNPRFSSTDPSRSLVRAPFRITLDVRIDLGKPLSEQQLDRWLTPGRGGDSRPRLSIDTLKARYGRNLPHLYRPILELSDSLLLSPGQVRALEQAEQAWQQRLDTLWTELATHMHELPDSYNTTRALEYQETMLDRAWEMSRLEAQERLPQIMNPVQLRLLPYPARMLYETKTPFGPKQRIRYYRS